MSHRGDDRFAGIERRLTVLTWIAGTNLAVTVAILWRLFAG